MRSSSRLLDWHKIYGLVLIAALSTPLSAQGTKPLPLKYSGPPTVAAITAGDLMTRLYKYADDSMMGREVGTVYHHKAVAYLASELKKLGLQPGGPDGSYYQDFPIWSFGFDTTATIATLDRPLEFGKDFVVVTERAFSTREDQIQPGGPLAPNFSNLPVVWAGDLADTSSMLDPEALVGKILMFHRLELPDGTDSSAEARIRASASYRAFEKAGESAAFRVQVLGGALNPIYGRLYGRNQETLTEPQTAGKPAAIVVTPEAAQDMFGAPLATAKRGQFGGPVSMHSRFVIENKPAGRNVVAILPGSDPKLKGEYVAIGAHSDHVGFQSGGNFGMHDSLRVYNKVGRPAGAEGGRNLRSDPIKPEEWAKINSEIAALRKVYPDRPDSIANGADDDGSGSVTVLEIAQAFAAAKQKPKRSILFVWHAGEEKGMWGSSYFMANPTVPRDSITAQLNIDMVGRGAASDVTGQGKAEQGKQPEILHGGDNYLQLVGSRRLSTELGDLVEKVNKDKKLGFKFDYHIDANGHQQNIYCRSDHWSYAKWGVPVVFFTTGGHADYHQVTDEPQYIEYSHMARVGNLIYDIANRVADLNHRVVVDHPLSGPIPATQCKQ